MWRVAHVLVALVVAASGARAQDEPGHVLGPGQEAVLRELLGGPPMAGCVLARAEIDRGTVSATYTCGGRRVGIVLRHPSAAGPALARSSVVAIASDDAPPDELVASIRRRSELSSMRLHWTASAEAPDAARPAPRVADFVLRDDVPRALGACLVLVLALGLGRFRARHALLEASGLGGALAIALSASLRTFADAGCAGALGLRSTATLVALVALPCVLAVSAVVWRWRRRSRSPAERATALAIPLLALLALWTLGIVAAADGATRVAHFGSLSTGNRPGAPIDTDPRRPAVRDRWNRHGFRGPAWSATPVPGVPRIVVVGDSFVAGLGVRFPETLGERLRAALAASRPEVLNLGIPGDNLRSHIDALRIAEAMLAPTLLVLCVNMPNDLSDFDLQVELRDAARPSALSYFRALVGPRPTAWAFGARHLARRMDAPARAILARELRRLARERTGRVAPPLLVFGFGNTDDQLASLVGRVPRALLVPAVETRAGFAIPGDGHPTAAANVAYARAIAEVIRRERWLEGRP